MKKRERRGNRKIYVKGEICTYIRQKLSFESIDVESIAAFLPRDVALHISLADALAV